MSRFISAVKSNTPIYKYAVTIGYVYLNKDGKEKTIEMSKSAKKGTEHEMDKVRCQKVYAKAVKKYANLRNGGPYFYDRQHSLYSLTLLKDEVTDSEKPRIKDFYRRRWLSK